MPSFVHTQPELILFATVHYLFIDAPHTITATPGSQGLDSRALDIAEEEVNNEVGPKKNNHKETQARAVLVDACR